MNYEVLQIEGLIMFNIEVYTLQLPSGIFKSVPTIF